MIKNFRFVGIKNGFILRIYPLQKSLAFRLSKQFRPIFWVVPDGDACHWYWLYFAGWVSVCADLRSDRHE